MGCVRGPAGPEHIPLSADPSPLANVLAEAAACASGHPQATRKTTRKRVRTGLRRTLRRRHATPGPADVQASGDRLAPTPPHSRAGGAAGRAGWLLAARPPLSLRRRAREPAVRCSASASPSVFFGPTRMQTLA